MAREKDLKRVERAVVDANRQIKEVPIHNYCALANAFIQRHGVCHSFLPSIYSMSGPVISAQTKIFNGIEAKPFAHEDIETIISL